MKKITEPKPYIYSWAKKAYSAVVGGATVPVGSCQLITMLLEWNDHFDISGMHNILQPLLQQGQGTSLPLNKFAIGDYTAQFTIKNATNLEITMDIYTCMVRNDEDYVIGVSTNWSGLGTVMYDDLLHLLPEGYREQSGVSSGPSLGSWPVGVSPYDINRFCTYVKILKVKRNVTIMGGGFKTYCVKDKAWRMYNGEKVYGCVGNAVNAPGASSVVFGGRTKFVFAIIRGAAVSENNTLSANYGPVEVLLTGNERYHFTGINNTSSSMTYMADEDRTIGPTNLVTINVATEASSGFVMV